MRKRLAKLVRGFHAAYGCYLFALCVLMVYNSWFAALLAATLTINIALLIALDGCPLTILADWLEEELWK